MPEQKKNKGAASKASDSPENLLDQFGGSKKSAPKKASPPPQKPQVEHKVAASERVDAQSKKKASHNSDAETAKKNPEKKPSSESKSSKEPTHASTADKASPRRPKEDTGSPKRAIDLDDQPRSARPAHKVIPYALIVLAVLIGITLLLNLICNPRNELQTDPASHPMGLVGYAICYALFGIFGPAVFALPLLMVILAFFWKRYIDRHIATAKTVVSLVFLLLFGAVIHVCCLIVLDPSQRVMSAGELMKHGSEMTGGGVLGGLLGAFLLKYFNFAGALIIGILLLGVSLFFILGLTPERVFESMRTRRKLRRGMDRDHLTGVSEQEAELARDRARMDERIRRTVTRHQEPDDEHTPIVTPESPAPASAEKARSKKSSEDKLAPMPVPHLNPGSDHRLFVPSDVTRRMREGEQTKQAPQQRATAPETPATPAAPVLIKPEPATPKTATPAQNRDAAVEPIFPKTTDANPTRHMPKEDRNFDLKNVFIDLDDKEQSTKKHAPVPPEVPPVLSPIPKSTTTKPQATGKTPVTQEKPTVRPTPIAKPQPGRAPSLAAVKPAPAANGNTVFRKADGAAQTDYGLSPEEFEKLEANKPEQTQKRTAAKQTADGKKTTPAVPVKATDSKKAAPTPKTVPAKKYVFPPISYLQPGAPMTAENRAEIESNMHQLAATLESFRVRVQEITYSCGPTVTRYEVVLATGVRVRNVTNLADDIALALRSPGGVRIEAPIPGTNAVGIEVPNKTRSTIFLRDLIESKAFTDAKSKLSACLGADIAGNPLVFDIAKMPHLLIAGTTGSGKSVCINSIVTSLLYKVRPDEVKMVMIDPKKVEFSIYKNIPHLMAPVVTQPKDAAGALQAAVEEMERRFELLETVGVHDLKGYNEATKDDPDMPFLPQIVIIIDELADLMMTAKNEVETAICRIAQKARAAGMHLIIGTQRPSADIVTGLIKSNVPSAIAFAVKSQIDSRVILDHGGAESLTGMGDMLFVPIGARRDTRVQGAFVSDKEVEKICEFIRVTNGTAQYDERFTAKLKELAAQCGSKAKADEAVAIGENGERGDDPKYEEAIQIALEENRVATSLLQRKLGIGYSRAAKIIDRMQAEGIVSAPDGSKPRAILMTHEQYLERKAQKQAEEADN